MELGKDFFVFTLEKGNKAIMSELHSKIKNLIDKKYKKFILNFKNKTYYDSYAANELERIVQTINKNNGKIVLIGVSNNFKNYLTVGGNVKIYTFANSRKEAEKILANKK